MNPIRVRGHYDHPKSIWQVSMRIDDPWHPGGHLTYRSPEIIRINGEVYLCQYQPGDKQHWPGVQPTALPEWRYDPHQRATGYRIRFFDGHEFGCEAAAGEDCVDFQYTFRNGGDEPADLTTGSCMMVFGDPPFVDRAHQRSYAWVDDQPYRLNTLPPTREDKQRWSWVVLTRDGQGEHMTDPDMEQHLKRGNLTDGLLAVGDQSGPRWLGLVWDNARQVMSRSSIPCIHSEPRYPTAQPGQAVSARGRLYFFEGTLDELAARYRQDRADGVFETALT